MVKAWSGPGLRFFRGNLLAVGRESISNVVCRIYNFGPESVRQRAFEQYYVFRGTQGSLRFFGNRVIF